VSFDLKEKRNNKKKKDEEEMLMLISNFVITACSSLTRFLATLLQILKLRTFAFPARRALVLFYPIFNVMFP
jgi:hypothetical protein